MTVQRRRDSSRAWFTPREPDQAVRKWGDVLARSGRKHVLDVGCGGGRHIVYLSRLGMVVTGGDQSALALSESGRWLARERLRADLVQLEMTTLPFHSETYDAVLSVNVLHHTQLGEAQAAVREVWRVLKPGGLFLAVMAGPGDCQCLLERPATPAQGVLQFTPARRPNRPQCDEHDLHNLFAGFNILDTQRHTLRLPDGTGPPYWRGVNWRIWAERPIA